LWCLTLKHNEWINSSRYENEGSESPPAAVSCHLSCCTSNGWEELNNKAINKREKLKTNLMVEIKAGPTAVEIEQERIRVREWMVILNTSFSFDFISFHASRFLQQPFVFLQVLATTIVSNWEDDQQKDKGTNLVS